MWLFKRLRKRFKGTPIIATSNNILMPFNREIYLRIEADALKEIREAKEKSSENLFKK